MTKIDNVKSLLAQLAKVPEDVQVRIYLVHHPRSKFYLVHRPTRLQEIFELVIEWQRSREGETYVAHKVQDITWRIL